MKQPGKPDFCFTLANHWSYTGIGWQLGLESCAESVRDSLAMADYDPSVKTCLNLDALAYELVAEHYPDIAQRLREYLRAGKVEIVGGSYGQPMGSMVSGESNLRQLVLGQQCIRRTLGEYVASFLEEEEFSHPQVPQLAALAGYRFASLAQCDTWGRHGSPRLDLNLFRWRGVDGTTLLATAINGLVFHPPAVTHDIDWLWTRRGRKRLGRLQKLGTPLAIKWTEFGWETLGGKAINKFDPVKFRELSKRFRVRYTTLTEYLAAYGAEAKETVRLRMDDFAKLLPWGIGGDQVRRFGREVEALLVAAERFDAVAHRLGLPVAPLAKLEQAWKNLLIAQSHDVSLCEYSRWGGGIAPPLDPVFDAHFLTWGSVGYRYMDDAKKLGQEVLRKALASLCGRINTAGPRRGAKAVVVFNPCGFTRDALATTGKIYFGQATGNHLVVRDARGRIVPSQLLGHQRDAAGRLIHADVALLTKDLPSVGYDTYRLETCERPPEPHRTDLRVVEAAGKLENAQVSVTIDPVTGAITSLRDRGTGKQLLDAFPRFTGRPNAAQRAPHKVVDAYDSAGSRAEITWLERGPLRATVKAKHAWPGLFFETYVTLCADAPAVEVRVRVSAGIPPAVGEGKIGGWRFPLAIKEGYWLRWALAFAPRAVIRDYPFGVEACGKRAIDALSFVDFVGRDRGLLLVHGGTQYFRRDGDRCFSNLVMREWESHFTGEYGWPRIADYRYLLIPHKGKLTNADRLRVAEAFDQKSICIVSQPGRGSLPTRESFVAVTGSNVQLSAFRRVGPREDELRIVECGGADSKVALRVRLPLQSIQQTNLLGVRAGNKTTFAGRHGATLRGWQIKNFRLEQKRPATKWNR